MEIGYIPNRTSLFEAECNILATDNYKDTVYYDHTIPLIQDILFGLTDKEIEFIILEDELELNK